MAGKLPNQIVLVGCGKMGTALLNGWIHNHFPPKNIFVIEPDRKRREVLLDLGINLIDNVSNLTCNDAALIFAIKPQIMANILPNYITFAKNCTVVISIAAGCPVALFNEYLGEVPIVRAMPNTPAAIGMSMTVAYACTNCQSNHIKTSENLLKAIGKVSWILQEDLMDAVTAISGSGPAYVFLLIEALSAAGINAGLPSELAFRLANETVRGAGELATVSVEPPEQLRINVTSPGGTTEAALDVLMAKNGLSQLVEHAVSAATKRSQGLAR